MSVNPRQEKVDPLTQQAALIEYYRRDFLRYSRDQLKIVTRRSKMVPLILNNEQQIIHQVVQKMVERQQPARIMILKPRQIGVTTYFCARAIYRTALFPFTNAFTVAHDLDTAEHIFSITRTLYDYLHPKVKPMCREMTKRSIIFENPKPELRYNSPGLRSSIRVSTAKNVNVGASRTIQFLHLSEVGRYDEGVIDDIKTSLFPTVPDTPNTLIVMESTAKGANKFFHKEWLDAKKGHSIYTPVFIPWFKHRHYFIPLCQGEHLKLTPEERTLKQRFRLSDHQLKWRRVQIEKLKDVALFAQDYPATDEEAWLYSGRGAFESQHLHLFRSMVHPPLLRGTILSDNRLIQDNQNGELVIYEQPTPNHQYVIGVDVSLGHEDGAWSVIEVVDVLTLHQVAQWRGKRSPIDLAHVITPIAKFYNQAQVAVEITGCGFSTNTELSKSYWNIYRWKKRDEIALRSTNKTGWDTSKQSKRFMVSIMRDYFQKRYEEKNTLVIYDETLYQELCNFVHYGEDLYEADSGYSDCVMAYGIALVAAYDEQFSDSYKDTFVEAVQQFSYQEPYLSDREFDRFLEEGPQEDMVVKQFWSY